VVGAREEAPNIVCIRVRIVIGVISIDIVKDKKPVGIVLLSKPAHDLSDNYINVDVPVCTECPTRLGDLALWDPACAIRNAPHQAILAPSIQPEHGTKLTVMLAGKLNGQLRLTYPTEPMKHKYLLSIALPFREESSFQLCHLGWSSYKFAHSRDTFEAKECSIFSKVYINVQLHD
jgi:hypothetical protein